MTSDTVVRVLSICVVLAGAETLHGIARTVLVVPRIGKERALKLSIVTGSLLALAICFWLVPGVGLAGWREHLVLGLCLAAFMAAFDLAMGRWLLRRSWSKALQDFNPATGNYLVYGLGLLACAPAIVWWIGSRPAGA
jgi:hypothetical protein